MTPEPAPARDAAEKDSAEDALRLRPRSLGTMRFSVLALDYDGTIAADGTLYPGARDAIEEVRGRGIAVVLVTGRILDDLEKVAGSLRLFDAVVAEGGAVLAFPRSGRVFTLAAPPSAVFLEALAHAGITFKAGQCVVEAEADHAARILELVRELDLPLVIVFNRGRLMVLPQSISKATGLREALSTLRLSPHNAVGIGDAENDHALLEACELGVAVPWATRELRARADQVIEGSDPRAVVDYIRSLCAELRLPPPRASRPGALLGVSGDGRPVTLALRGRNVLLAGEPGSGKSWLAGLLCEHLILEHYSVCVIDPEGDYAPLAALPGVLVLGADGPPCLQDLRGILRFPETSVVIDLSTTPLDARLEYVPALLKVVADVRRESGLPHRIVVDEAHYFLDHPEVLRSLDMALASYMLVTYQASRLEPRVLGSADVVLVTREADPGEVRALRSILGGAGSEAEWQQALGALAIDEAALLGRGSGVPQPFRIAPRLTAHTRHRRKYADVPVAPQRAFVFTRQGVPTGERAGTLRELATALASSPSDEIGGHIRRHDFSRWIDDVFRDRTTAEVVRELEARQAVAPDPAVGANLAKHIRDRYLLAGQEEQAG
jgi:hydroxymethylpyrimidine pyrophosphatase-like HAD family hydrolase